MARREWDEEILRIELAARAETASDVVLHDLDGAFGQSHLFRQGAAIEKQDLGAAGKSETPARRVPFREQPARLQGQRHVSLGAKALAPDVTRVGERRGGIPAHAAELDREV